MWLGAWGWVVNSQQSCATQLPWFVLDACRVSYGLIAFYCLRICYDVDMFTSCDYGPQAICGLGVRCFLHLASWSRKRSLRRTTKGRSSGICPGLRVLSLSFYELEGVRLCKGMGCLYPNL